MCEPGAHSYSPSVHQLSCLLTCSVLCYACPLVSAEVPPGRYLVQNVVRECPAGTFRRPYSMVTEESAKICYSCPPGITTSSSAATSEAACNVVGPGVSITGSQLQAAQTQAASIAGANNDTLAADFNSTLCDYGFYYGGGVVPTSSQGTCQMCPEGTTTQQMGSTSMSDCSKCKLCYMAAVQCFRSSIATVPLNCLSGTSCLTCARVSLVDQQAESMCHAQQLQRLS